MPSAVMVGITMYESGIHAGKCRKQAISQGWTYGVLAAGFHFAVYAIKLVSAGHAA
jgi:hypothetical protein